MKTFIVIGGPNHGKRIMVQGRELNHLLLSDPSDETHVSLYRLVRFPYVAPDLATYAYIWDKLKTAEAHQIYLAEFRETR
jgi:hypothetical protein